MNMNVCPASAELFAPSCLQSFNWLRFRELTKCTCVSSVADDDTGTSTSSVPLIRFESTYRSIGSGYASTSVMFARACSVTRTIPAATWIGAVHWPGNVDTSKSFPSGGLTVKSNWPVTNASPPSASLHTSM